MSAFQNFENCQQMASILHAMLKQNLNLKCTLMCLYLHCHVKPLELKFYDGEHIYNQTYEIQLISLSSTRCT